MRHWIQSVKDRWKTTSPKVEQPRDYNPGKDFMKSIREREQAEKKRKERWSKELKQKMNTKNTYSYTGGAVSSGTYSNSYTINSNTITKSLADAKIRIDGGENGIMQVDVPLIVHGRDVMKEIDEMRDALLLLKRDVDMESKYNQKPGSNRSAKGIACNLRLDKFVVGHVLIETVNDPIDTLLTYKQSQTH